MQHLHAHADTCSQYKAIHEKGRSGTCQEGRSHIDNTNVPQVGATLRVHVSDGGSICHTHRSSCPMRFKLATAQGRDMSRRHLDSSPHAQHIFWLPRGFDCAQQPHAACQSQQLSAHFPHLEYSQEQSQILISDLACQQSRIPGRNFLRSASNVHLISRKPQSNERRCC
jgi:hypothetical protein